MGARVAVRRGRSAPTRSPRGAGRRAFDVAVANPPYPPARRRAGVARPRSGDRAARAERHARRRRGGDAARRSSRADARRSSIRPARVDGAPGRARRRRAAPAARCASCIRAPTSRPTACSSRRSKGARGPLVVEPPLVLRDADGYSAEARAPPRRATERLLRRLPPLTFTSADACWRRRTRRTCRTRSAARPPPCAPAASHRAPCPAPG